MSKDFDQISSLLQQAHKDAQEKGGYKPPAGELDPAMGGAPDPVITFKRQMMASAAIRRRIRSYQRESKRLLKPHQWVMLIIAVSIVSLGVIMLLRYLSQSSTYRRYLRNGVHALYEGNISTANRILEELTESMPENRYKMLLTYGRALEKMGRWEEARNYYRYALVSKRELLEPYLFFAKYAVHKHDIRGALSKLDYILTKMPAHVEARRLRGKLYIENYRIDEAEKDFSEIIKIFPADFPAHFYLQKIYHLKGLIKSELREQKFLLQSDVENVSDIDALLGVANSLLAEGALSRAKTVIDRALAVVPRNPRAHFYMARLRLAEEKPEDALHEVDLALKFSTDIFPEAHNLRGEILYYKLKQVEKAVEEFKITLKQNPYYPDAHFNLAQVLYYELDDAPGIWKTILDEYLLAKKYKYLYVDDPLFLYNLGVCFYKVRDFKKAASIWSPLLQKYGENPDIFYALGNAYFLSGNQKAARENYETALNMDINFFKVINNLSIVLEQTGEKKQALENLWFLIRNQKLNPREHNTVDRNLKRMLKGDPANPLKDYLITDISKWP